jgi:hypothetical protein
VSLENRATLRTGRVLPAVTWISVELCSTPYKVLRFAPTPLAHPNAAAALGASGAGPADLDGVCAQLANLALTCRRGRRAWLLRTSVGIDT